jgi:hypothetical protein
MANKESSLTDKAPAPLAEENTAEVTADASASAPREKPKEKPPERPGRYIYIGPSLPSGLNANTILTGTLTEIKAHYKSALEKYPKAERLIVPAEKAGEALAKLTAPENIVRNDFDDVAAAVRKGREK